MHDRTQFVRPAFHHVSASSLVVLCVMLMPSMAYAQRHELMTDQAIKNRVEHEISETDVNGMNVRVQVTNRMVTLTGAVPSLWAKNKLIDEARDR